MREELMAELQQLSDQRDMEWAVKQQEKPQPQQQQLTETKERNILPLKAHDDNGENADEEDDGIVVIAPRRTWAENEHGFRMYRQMRRMYPSPYSTISCHYLRVIQWLRATD